MSQAELNYYERVPRLLASIEQSLATIAKALESMSRQTPNTSASTDELKK